MNRARYALEKYARKKLAGKTFMTAKARPMGQGIFHRLAGRGHHRLSGDADGAPRDRVAGADDGRIASNTVMPGLVPGIHDLLGI
jgi:hypothetical protein